MVAVLAGYGNALEALGGERRHHAARHAVVGADHHVHAILVGREDLLHHALRQLGQPAVHVLLAHHLDAAGLDGGAQHLDLPGVHEVRVGILGGALDEDVAALGPHRLERARLQAPDLHVVEGDVEDARRLDQAVVGDHRNPLGPGEGERGMDGVGVLGQEDQDVGAAGDQAFDVRELLLARALGVGGEVARAPRRQGLRASRPRRSSSAPPGSSTS